MTCKLTSNDNRARRLPMHYAITDDKMQSKLTPKSHIESTITNNPTISSSVLKTAMTALLVLGLGIFARSGEVGPSVRDIYGPAFQTAQPLPQTPQAQLRANDSIGRIYYWNEIAINASGLDHTPVAPGENRVFGEQVGPGRSSRALAIVQIAVFDAVNAITGGYRSYAGLPDVPNDASIEAAIAQAAHDTLVALFPSQATRFNARLAEDLMLLRNNHPKTKGIAIGKQAAQAILALRANDGSQHSEPRVGIEFFPLNGAGKWQPDPISQSPLALGAHWYGVTPFVLQSASQFRAPTPPTLNSAAFAVALDEVSRLGGDGVITPTERTAEQTFIGIYWAYDGTPSLCAPPRLYNQIAAQISLRKHYTPVQLARLFALVNVAMADATLCVWESKYFYQYCRPVTAIRALNDASFTPLGAPASNLNGPNFTPPFPAYPSGHAGMGGALFQILRRFHGTDQIAFTFVSDEFNGVTRDNQGMVRPLMPRTFGSLSAAEEENGQSRIYLGIHWAFDKTDGIAQGRQAADYVFANAFQPTRGR